jgi:hypothetical protein
VGHVPRQPPGRGAQLAAGAQPRRDDRLPLAGPHRRRRQPWRLLRLGAVHQHPPLAVAVGMVGGRPGVSICTVGSGVGCAGRVAGAVGIKGNHLGPVRLGVGVGIEVGAGVVVAVGHDGCSLRGWAAAGRVVVVGGAVVIARRHTSRSSRREGRRESAGWRPSGARRAPLAAGRGSGAGREKLAAFSADNVTLAVGGDGVRWR